MSIIPSIAGLCALFVDIIGKTNESLRYRQTLWENYLYLCIIKMLGHENSD